MATTPLDIRKMKDVDADIPGSLIRLKKEMCPIHIPNNGAGNVGNCVISSRR
jgi:hypothetical protein